MTLVSKGEVIGLALTFIITTFKDLIPETSLIDFLELGIAYNIF
jgi:hypothetical protein